MGEKQGLIKTDTTMGYNNIGPNYWKGEEGRLALIAGDQNLTDEAGVAPYRTLAKWGAYLGDGFEAQTYPTAKTCSLWATPRFIRLEAGKLPGSMLWLTLKWALLSHRCKTLATTATFPIARILRWA
jgi:hypothetical protein